MNTISEEFRYRLPKLIANVSIVLIFIGMSYIVGWSLTGISTEIVFLLQIGLLLASGIFLVRTLFDTLTVIDKTTKVFLKSLGIKKELSRQRVFKDLMYMVAILLVSATIFPLLSNLSSVGALLQEITTYAALALILLFVYDIARTFYRVTEKRANSFANRNSNEGKNN